MTTVNEGQGATVAKSHGTPIMGVRNDALTDRSSGDATFVALTLDAKGRVVIGAIAAGNTNIGDVDVASIAAGTNNIGDVDVLTLPDVRASWRVSTLSFITIDDSDNTFTVPATTEYQVLSVYVSLVTTATVGNRQMAVHALDASDNILLDVRAGAVQAASLTRVYNFGPSFTQDAAFRDTNYLSIAMPPIFLAAGQKLRVFDKAAVAAAADDMVVRVQIASRSVA